MQPRILVADDQADILSALKLLLKREGFEVTTASSPAGVLDIVAREHVDVALVDLNYSRDTTSGEEGTALVEKLHRDHPDLPVIVMTAWATVEVAVKAMRNGANDFLEKPWNNQRLLTVLRNQVQLAEARRHGRRLADENAILRAADGTDLIATSRPMQEVVRLARQVARSSASVLITGEPGTGKSLLAKLVHDWSDRAEKSFISVNAGGLPESVFESEMFGHVKGAFTDAKADRGGPLRARGRRHAVPRRDRQRAAGAAGAPLARARDGRVRARRLLAHAARRRARGVGDERGPAGDDPRRALPRGPAVPHQHGRDPAAAVAGAARGDPRARDRAARAQGGAVRAPGQGIRPAGAVRAAEYAWPGNVRELNSVVERSLLLAAGDEIGAADLRLSAAKSGPPSLEEMSLEDAERALIRSAIRRNGGSVQAAADALGLSRSAMYRRLEKLGLKPDEL